MEVKAEFAALAAVPAHAGQPGQRRAAQFWESFNNWWRDEYIALGDRKPKTQAIVRWYQSYAHIVWTDDERPTLKETKRHAKGLRPKGEIREYFRKYRAVKGRTDTKKGRSAMLARKAGAVVGSEAEGVSPPCVSGRRPRRASRSKDSKQQPAQRGADSDSDDSEQEGLGGEGDPDGSESDADSSASEGGERNGIQYAAHGAEKNRQQQPMLAAQLAGISSNKRGADGVLRSGSLSVLACGGLHPQPMLATSYTLPATTSLAEAAAMAQAMIAQQRERQQQQHQHQMGAGVGGERGQSSFGAGEGDLASPAHGQQGDAHHDEPAAKRRQSRLSCARGAKAAPITTGVPNRSLDCTPLITAKTHGSAKQRGGAGGGLSSPAAGSGGRQSAQGHGGLLRSASLGHGLLPAPSTITTGQHVRDRFALDSGMEDSMDDGAGDGSRWVLGGYADGLLPTRGSAGTASNKSDVTQHGSFAGQLPQGGLHGLQQGLPTLLLTGGSLLMDMPCSPQQPCRLFTCARCTGRGVGTVVLANMPALGRGSMQAAEHMAGRLPPGSIPMSLPMPFANVSARFLADEADTLTGSPADMRALLTSCSRQNSLSAALQGMPRSAPAGGGMGSLGSMGLGQLRLASLSGSTPQGLGAMHALQAAGRTLSNASSALQQGGQGGSAVQQQRAAVAAGVQGMAGLSPSWGNGGHSGSGGGFIGQLSPPTTAKAQLAGLGLWGVGADDSYDVLPSVGSMELIWQARQHEAMQQLGAAAAAAGGAGGLSMQSLAALQGSASPHAAALRQQQHHTLVLAEASGNGLLNAGLLSMGAANSMLQAGGWAGNALQGFDVHPKLNMQGLGSGNLHLAMSGGMMGGGLSVLPQHSRAMSLPMASLQLQQQQQQQLNLLQQLQQRGQLAGLAGGHPLGGSLVQLGPGAALEPSVPMLTHGTPTTGFV